MKTSLIVLLLVPLTAAGQWFDDPYAGDRFTVSPNLNTAPGYSVRDEYGNSWNYSPNLNTAPGGTLQRRRAYQMLRDRDYRENYDPSYGNVYRQ